MFDRKFNDTINKLEENLTNKKDLEFVKKQVTNLAMAYIDELTNIEKRYESRISFCENRIDELENHLLKLEKDLFEDEEDDDIDYEPITCPYCNAHFMIEFDSDVTEMQCPDCNNIIELDWGDFEDDDEDDDM